MANGNTRHDKVSELRPASRPRSPKTVDTVSGNTTPPDPQPRFHLFVLDSGWDSEAAAVIHENMEALMDWMPECPIFVLTREQSRALLRKDPERIGYDPCLILHDLHAAGGHGESGYHGVRLSLGAAKNREAALQLLQAFLRFTVIHRQCGDVEKAVRHQLHKEGLVNLIEILRDVR